MKISASWRAFIIAQISCLMGMIVNAYRLGFFPSLIMGAVIGFSCTYFLGDFEKIDDL